MLPGRIAARGTRQKRALGDIRHNARVAFVRGTAVRWVDEEWPGWIEVQIVVDGGTTVSLIDKVPVFDAGDQIMPGTKFPVPIRVACDVVDGESEYEGRRVTVIALRYQVEDGAGRNSFRVAAEGVEAAP
jgi:hypothetical protein